MLVRPPRAARKVLTQCMGHLGEWILFKYEPELIANAHKVNMFQVAHSLLEPKGLWFTTKRVEGGGAFEMIEVQTVKVERVNREDGKLEWQKERTFDRPKQAVA